jgi:group I intron endonuclease
MVAVAGVYAIRDRATGKMYVGSSTDIYRRFSEHRIQLRRNQHHCIHLQRAWNSAGEGAFVFAILQTCVRADLLRLEQQYIDSGIRKGNIYNVAAVAARHQTGYGKRVLIQRKGNTLTRKTVITKRR